MEVLEVQGLQLEEALWKEKGLPAPWAGWEFLASGAPRAHLARLEVRSVQAARERRGARERWGAQEQADRQEAAVVRVASARQALAQVRAQRVPQVPLAPRVPQVPLAR